MKKKKSLVFLGFYKMLLKSQQGVQPVSITMVESSLCCALLHTYTEADRYFHFSFLSRLTKENVCGENEMKFGQSH